MNATALRMAAIFATFLLSFFLSGCGQQEKHAVDSLSDEDSQPSASPEELAARDWSADTATRIRLLDSEINVDGAGAAVNRHTVTITRGGDYLVEGSLSNGQLVIDAGPEDQIRLILNNASIASNNGAAVNMICGGFLAITLPIGTESSLSSHGSAKEAMAAVRSQRDIAVGGDGALMVRAPQGDGIHSQQAVHIAGGSLNVAAQGIGLLGEDSVRISGGKLLLDSQGQGLDSNGEVAIVGGLVQIVGSGPDPSNGEPRNILVDGGVLLVTESTTLEPIKGHLAQPVLAFHFLTPQQPDTLINLSSADGANLLSFSPMRPYCSLVVSTPSLEIGGHYILSTGGSDNGSRVTNLFYGGEYQGGMPILDITLSESTGNWYESSESLSAQ